MNLIESGDVGWDDPDVVKVLKDTVREQSPKYNHQKIALNLKESQKDAPSARLTSFECARIPKIRLELAQQGIAAESWELKALTRGATFIFDSIHVSFPMIIEWPGFNSEEV